MDTEKIGGLISALRKEKNMTQKQLGDLLNITDKTVSKWECGQGCPDVSLLPALSEALAVGIEQILSGELSLGDDERGNMKKTKFYVCEKCGNFVTSSGELSVSCCGRRLSALEAVKAMDEHEIKVEKIENDWYVTAAHEMEKEHFLSFIALVTSEKMTLIRKYPEWDMSARFPSNEHGILYTYCTSHGLFYKLI